MGGENPRGPGRRDDHRAACGQGPPRWTQTYMLPEGSGEVADLWDPGAGHLFCPPAPSHLLGGRKWAGLVLPSWLPRPCIPRPTSSPQDISSTIPALESLQRGGVTRGSDSQPCFCPRPLSGLLDEREEVPPGRLYRLPDQSTKWGAGLSQVWCGAASPPLPPPRALQRLGVNDPLSFLPPRPSSSPRSEPPAPLPQLSPTPSGLEKGWGLQTPEPTSPSAWLIPTDPVPRAVRGRQEAAKVRDGRRRRQEQETAAVERAKPGGLWAPRAVPERSSSPSTSQLLSPGINADPAMLTLSPAPSP